MRQITAPHYWLLFEIKHMHYWPPEGDSKFWVPDPQSCFWGKPWYLPLEILNALDASRVCSSLYGMVTGVITQEIRIFQFFDLSDQCWWILTFTKVFDSWILWTEVHKVKAALSQFTYVKEFNTNDTKRIFYEQCMLTNSVVVKIYIDNNYLINFKMDFYFYCV